jgi:hypothetical protein
LKPVYIGLASVTLILFVTNIIVRLAKYLKVNIVINLYFIILCFLLSSVTAVISYFLSKGYEHSEENSNNLFIGILIFLTFSLFVFFIKL